MNKRTVTLFSTLFRYFLNLDNRISRERERERKEGRKYRSNSMRFWFLRNFRKRERTTAQFRSIHRGETVCPVRFKFPRVERGQELAREGNFRSSRETEALRTASRKRGARSFAQGEERKGES